MPAHEMVKAIQQSEYELIEQTIKQMALYPEYFINELNFKKLDTAKIEESSRGMVMIAKTTHACNLSCHYCYDKLNRKPLTAEGNHCTMELVKKNLQVFGQEKGIRQWIWHGGEPLMLDPKFYEEANAEILKFDNTIDICMQSNGTLLDEERLSMLKKYKIRPGLSFDGLNNHLTRKDSPRLMEVLNQLEQAGILGGCIMVINKDSIHQIIEEYEYFKRLGLNVKMNLIFSALENGKSYTLDGEMVAREVCRFFDYWIHDTYKPMDSDLVNRYLTAAFGEDLLCEFRDCVGNQNWFSTQPNGDVFNCGRDWDEKTYCFGNMKAINHMSDILSSPNYQHWYEGTRKLLKNCSSCDFYYSCHGGCFNNDANYDPTFSKPEPNNCKMHQAIMKHIIKTLLELSYSDLCQLNPYFVRQLIRLGFRGYDLIEKSNILAQKRIEEPIKAKELLYNALNQEKEG